MYHERVKENISTDQPTCSPRAIVYSAKRICEYSIALTKDILCDHICLGHGLKHI